MNDHLEYRIHSVCAFEPHGTDVYATQMLLNIQFLQVAIGVYDVAQEIRKGKLHGQKLDMVRILQGLFSIPFLLISIYLYLRFKHAFCRQYQRNIILISYLMISENILNVILRFTVGVKLVLVEFTFDKQVINNFIIPVIFAILWILVFYIAYGKNGEYGAPPGMLYMQNEAELIEKERLMSEYYQKYSPEYYQQESTQSSDNGKSDIIDSRQNQNDTTLNYEDTEAMPGSEEMNPCYYNDDIEKLPLYQPRDTIKSLQSTGYESKSEVRNSCPAKERTSLARALAVKHLKNRSLKQNSLKYEVQKNFILKQKGNQNSLPKSSQQYQFFKFNNKNQKKEEQDKLSTFTVSSSTSSTLSLQLIGKQKMPVVEIPETILETAEIEFQNSDR